MCACLSVCVEETEREAHEIPLYFCLPPFLKTESNWHRDLYALPLQCPGQSVSTLILKGDSKLLCSEGVFKMSHPVPPWLGVEGD